MAQWRPLICLDDCRDALAVLGATILGLRTNKFVTDVLTEAAKEGGKEVAKAAIARWWEWRSSYKAEPDREASVNETQTLKSALEFPAAIAEDIIDTAVSIAPQKEAPTGGTPSSRTMKRRWDDVQVFSLAKRAEAQGVSIPTLVMLVQDLPAVIQERDSKVLSAADILATIRQSDPEMVIRKRDLGRVLPAKTVSYEPGDLRGLSDFEEKLPLPHVSGRKRNRVPSPPPADVQAIEAKQSDATATTSVSPVDTTGQRDLVNAIAQIEAIRTAMRSVLAVTEVILTELNPEEEEASARGLIAPKSKPSNISKSVVRLHCASRTLARAERSASALKVQFQAITDVSAGSRDALRSVELVSEVEKAISLLPADQSDRVGLHPSESPCGRWELEKIECVIDNILRNALAGEGGHPVWIRVGSSVGIAPWRFGTKAVGLLGIGAIMGRPALGAINHTYHRQ